jgi:guanylate kinase
MSNAPNLYVISAPSGGGKTSLVSALLARDERYRVSISHTTRKPRPGETDGVHYHFIDSDQFQKLIDKDAFLEYARVYGNYYGTGRRAVSDLLDQGFDVMLDIDWQGGRQVRESFPGCQTIFILPPSLAELQNRLSHRGQDSDSVIEMRMHLARAEIAHWDEFDHLVINDQFESAMDDLHSIVRRGRVARQGQKKRIKGLLAELLENV